MTRMYSDDRGEPGHVGRESWWAQAERDGDGWCASCQIHRVPKRVSSLTPTLCPSCLDDEATEETA